MEKYGVVTGNMNDELVKQAVEAGKCPACGAPLTNSNPPICPNCGSLPLETPEDEDSDGEE